MRTNAFSRLAMLCLAVIALVGLLAACGDDDEPSDVGSDGTTTTAAPDASEGSTTTVPQADLTVTVKEDPTLGAILADPEGKTLYTLTDDAGEPVECTGPCLAAWPALELASGATEPTAPEGVELTVVDGPDDSKLVAADGLPLYTFAGDGAPADATGEGLVSFGGTWRVVKTDAPATTPPAEPSDDSTTTSSVY